MSFGYQRQPRIFLDNTSTLNAYLYDQDGENLIPSTDITSVSFTVLKPGDSPTSPTISGAAGTIAADGQGQFVVTAATNDTAGQYLAIATFVYDEGGLVGLTKSIPVNYDCVDSFHRTGPIAADPSVDLAWLKLEDCFDSEDGGPWLRDMTLARFDKDKIRSFLPTVFLEINSEMPQTSFTPDAFPYETNDGVALVAQGLLIESIRHLMRSYTEQPDVVNSAIGFFDRKRYSEAWRSMYDVELDAWKRWLGLWKRRQLDFNNSRLLISQKAGRLLPAPLRSKYVGRGWY